MITGSGNPFSAVLAGVSLILLVGGAGVAGADSAARVESAEGRAGTRLPADPDPSNSDDSLQTEDEPVALPRGAAHSKGLLDVRGVGDAGMALTYEQPPLPEDSLPEGGRASFGERLDALDSTGTSYRGDLSFINWESVVGPRCKEFRGEPGPRSYAFVSHPQNLVAAHRRGFNLVGLANNHSQDCVQGAEGNLGTRMTARHVRTIGQSLGADWVWHGVGEREAARVRTVWRNGRPVRVAFASLYMADKECPYAACGEARTTVLRSLKTAEADLRILAIHSWNEETHQKLVETGEAFLREYKGDIVFGHGPHVWRNVRVVTSSSGEHGVLFESLGNFLHPSLAAQPRNLIGRVLLDQETLNVRQVQAISVSTDGASGQFSGAPAPTRIPSNRDWTPIREVSWHGAAGSQIKGAYFTLPPESTRPAESSSPRSPEDSSEVEAAPSEEEGR